MKVICKRCGTLMEEDLRSHHLLCNCFKEEEIPYRCGICDVKLISGSSLAKHAKKMHRFEKDNAINKAKEGKFAKME